MFTSALHSRRCDTRFTSSFSAARAKGVDIGPGLPHDCGTLLHKFGSALHCKSTAAQSWRWKQDAAQSGVTETPSVSSPASAGAFGSALNSKSAARRPRSSTKMALTRLLTWRESSEASSSLAPNWMSTRTQSTQRSDMACSSGVRPSPSRACTSACHSARAWTASVREVLNSARTAQCNAVLRSSRRTFKSALCSRSARTTPPWPWMQAARRGVHDIQSSSLRWYSQTALMSKLAFASSSATHAPVWPQRQAVVSGSSLRQDQAIASGRARRRTSAPPWTRALTAFTAPLSAAQKIGVLPSSSSSLFGSLPSAISCATRSASSACAASQSSEPGGMLSVRSRLRLSSCKRSFVISSVTLSNARRLSSAAAAAARCSAANASYRRSLSRSCLFKAVTSSHSSVASTFAPSKASDKRRFRFSAWGPA
mmetsp:Transcript_102155/g.288531  ORF Transcript_102155/g.288531 Transcript_102155/m.288531 type:complete len:426 (+) Transcript_102155:224-1501(+)